jgi:chaperonin GroEL (HSP60 family)
MDKLKDSLGFNVASEKVEDLLKEKIVEPKKIIKNILIHTISTAKIILLSEVLIKKE